jgi:hypothetical protein
VADFSGRDLAWLERRRADLLALIGQVGDFRRGALNAVWRKCGKPNCACAQPGHRGHGPQWNLTRRAGGKTVNVHLRPGPELEKARREVAEHQRFVGLVEEVSAVSEAICAARPVTASTASPPAGGERGGSGRGSRRSPPGLAEMIALAGAEVSFTRAGGLIVGLAGITVSPRTIERPAEASDAAARAAAQAETAGIVVRTIRPLPPAEPVSGMRYVETDGTGVPVRPGETEGRAGKPEEGKAGTREVKLARFFTVSRLDDDGRPVMDPGSPAYVFTVEGKNALQRLAEAEDLRRGGGHHRQVVALGDGAAWIWTMAEDLYPHASHIVDIYHAREHLTDLAAHLAFIIPDPAAWLTSRSEELDAGNIQAIAQAASCYPLAGVKAEELDKKLGYFRRNAHRMRYADGDRPCRYSSGSTSLICGSCAPTAAGSPS